MTRINCVPPEELSRQHLLAEWRELPRVFTLASDAHRARRKIDAPPEYTLGPGHVKFFYTRLGYCWERFFALRGEMLRRGYVPNYVQPPEALVPDDWRRTWTPDERAISINRQRIAERTTQK